MHWPLLDGILLDPSGGFKEECLVGGHLVKDDTGDG
jgi:hypothetical protein